MEQLIERILKAPWSTKIAVVVGVVALLTGLNYMMMVSPAGADIQRVDVQLKKLEGDFIDKQQIANNLNQYRREKELLEQKLKEALTELPNDRDLDELLRQLSDVATKSGLDIASVVPGKEAPEKFFARIPVRMKVAGNFHEIAVFFDSVGKLRRIVNINELKFGTPRQRNEKVVIDAEFTATAFRFIPPAEGQGTVTPAKGGAAPRAVGKPGDAK
jgi:type IV pilus assembly protein PilO